MIIEKGKTYNAKCTPVGLELSNEMGSQSTMPKEVMVRSNEQSSYVLYVGGIDTHPAECAVVVDDITDDCYYVTAPMMVMGKCPEIDRFPRSFENMEMVEGDYYLTVEHKCLVFRKDIKQGFKVYRENCRFQLHNGRLIQYNGNIIILDKYTKVHIRVKDGKVLVTDGFTIKEPEFPIEVVNLLAKRLFGSHTNMSAQGTACFVIKTIKPKNASITTENLTEYISEYFKQQTGEREFYGNVAGAAADLVGLTAMLSILFGYEFACYYMANKVPIEEVLWCDNIERFLAYDPHGRDLTAEYEATMWESIAFNSELYMREKVGKKFANLPKALIDGCTTAEECDAYLTPIINKGFFYDE